MRRLPLWTPSMIAKAGNYGQQRARRMDVRALSRMSAENFCDCLLRPADFHPGNTVKENVRQNVTQAFKDAAVRVSVRKFMDCACIMRHSMMTCGISRIERFTRASTDADRMNRFYR